MPAKKGLVRILQSSELVEQTYLVAMSGYPLAVIRILGMWLKTRSSASRWKMACCITNNVWQLTHVHDLWFIKFPHYCLQNHSWWAEQVIIYETEITFSMTITYRASVFRVNFCSRSKSPEMAYPEEPQAAQSTVSCSGSYSNWNCSERIRYSRIWFNRRNLRSAPCPDTKK